MAMRSVLMVCALVAGVGSGVAQTVAVHGDNGVVLGPPPVVAVKPVTEMAEPEDERRPILLHYDVKAGHSAGVSVDQLVRDEADELTFLWNETGGR